MKYTITIVIAICTIIAAFTIGYKKGAVDAMKSAVIVEDSKYHYGISYFDWEYECYYSK